MFEGNITMSDAERESLYNRIRAGDESARYELAMNYRPFVRGYVKRSLRSRRIDPSFENDLLNECFLGLLKAAENFDPDFGTILPTHANFHLKNAVEAFIAGVVNGTYASVQVGKQIRRVQKVIRKAKSSNTTVTVELLVEEARVSSDFARRYLTGQIQLGTALSLSKPVDDFSGEGELTWQDLLEADGLSAFDLMMQGELSHILHDALAVLSDRERLIVMGRHLGDETVILNDLGEELSITRERVRQIETRALKKLRRYLANRHHVRSVSDLLAGP